MATITEVISSTNNDHGTGLTVYTTLALWEAALPTTFGSDSYVGEIYNEGTAYGALTIAGQTIGSNTLTLKCAAGQSFRDHASAASNALFYDASKGVAINGGATNAVIVSIANTTLDGLQIKTTAGGYNNRPVVDLPNQSGVVLQNSILESNQTGAQVATARAASLKNCLLVQYGSGVGVNFAFGGNGDSFTLVRPGGSPSGTGVSGGYGGAAVLVNCAVFGFSTSFSSSGAGLTSTYTATDGTAQAGTGNVGSLTYTNQFVSTTNDFRLKAGADLIDTGATALTTDIIGQTRPTGSADDIGGWEYASGGGGTAVGLATETDAAQVLAGKQLRALGLATETDAAQALSGKQIRALGLATGTDSALALAGQQLRDVGLSTEVDTAQALSASAGDSVGMASESDTAFALAAVQKLLTGVVQEADTALTLSAGTGYTDLELILKILSNRQELNAGTGTFTIYDDDSVSVLFTASAWADAAGTVPYSGGTLGRIDALA